MDTVDNLPSLLLTLPNEILADIASCLNPPSLHALQLTNHRLRSIVSAELHDMFVLLKDEILLEAAAHDNDTLMQYAIAEGAKVPVTDILENKNIRSTDNTARVVLDVWAHSVRKAWEEPWLFYRMVQLRHVNVVQIMFDRGVLCDPDPESVHFAYRPLALSFAVRSGSAEMVELLLSYGFDVTTMPLPKRCFMSVLTTRNIPLMKAVLDAGILAVTTPYTSNGDPVHTTARSGTVEMMQLLLEYGASVNAVAKYGRTPLHQAVLYPGREEMLQFLLDKGADVDAKDHVGSTALYRAVGRGNAPAVRMLLRYGADAGLVSLHCWDRLRQKAVGPLVLGPYEEVRNALVEAGVVLKW